MFNIHFSVSHHSQSSAGQYQIGLLQSAFISLLVSMKFLSAVRPVADFSLSAQIPQIMFLREVTFISHSRLSEVKETLGLVETSWLQPRSIGIFLYYLESGHITSSPATTRTVQTESTGYV